MADIIKLSIPNNHRAGLFTTLNLHEYTHHKGQVSNDIDKLLHENFDRFYPDKLYEANGLRFLVVKKTYDQVTVRIHININQLTYNLITS
jgi:hypothetical protein